MVAIAITSCSKESIRGGGRTITETRTVAAFNAVLQQGSVNVNVMQGTPQKVEVTGYENLLPIYETTVQNGTLVLKFGDDFYNVRNSNIEVNITIPALVSAAVNGSGDYRIKDFNGNELKAEINGSSNIYTQNCIYNITHLRINGSGHIRAAEIQSKESNVEINGSGKIDIMCSQKLRAIIHGSGEVNYLGNPAVTAEISGSGKVRKQ